jgi:hypothetical protein
VEVNPMNASSVLDQWQSVIGIAALPAVLPLLVDHLKAALQRARPSETCPGSPWPLVTDLLAVAWTFALWNAGLLGEGLHMPSVVLLGLASGAAAGLGYDGWRQLRLRTADPEDR